MKKFFALLIIYSAFLNISYAQTAAKAAYLEIGGPGLASINFDMRFANKDNGAGFRIGAGAFPINKATVVTVPLGLNYLFGKSKKNYFEAGAGFTYLNISTSHKGTSKNFTSSFGNITLGYRHAPEKSGFFFKAELTPIIGSGFFLPFGGLGFGYKF